MELTFKEWLSFQEARFKGMKRMMQNRWPGMPRYVQNDLYNTRIGHAMNSAVGAKETGSMRADPTLSLSPIGSLGSDPKAPGKILQHAGLDNIQWSQKPEILVYKQQDGVTPAAFDEQTQYRFLDRRFGYRHEPKIRNDSQRTSTQQQLMQSRGEGSNEPIVVIQTMGGYKLLEGWHRTMNYLLSGAPRSQIEAIYGGNLDALDFNQWKPVKLMAYVGRGRQVQDALAGTGDY